MSSASSCGAAPGVATRNAWAGGGELLRRLSNPVESAQEAAEFVSSVSRVLATPEAEGSPLLRNRSLSWRFLALDVRFADLRAAAKAADATLNDAFLAALLGAFRLYHERMGEPVETIPIAIPISVRKEGDPAGRQQVRGWPGSRRPSVSPIRSRGCRRSESRSRAARSEPAIDALGRHRSRDDTASWARS